MSHLFPSGMLTYIIMGARNGHKKQTLKITLNSLFHIFKVWGNWLPIGGLHFSVKRRYERVLQGLGCIANVPVTWLWPRRPSGAPLSTPFPTVMVKGEWQQPQTRPARTQILQKRRSGLPQMEKPVSEGHTECTLEGGSWNDHRGPYDQL